MGERDSMQLEYERPSGVEWPPRWVYLFFNVMVIFGIAMLVVIFLAAAGLLPGLARSY